MVTLLFLKVPAPTETYTFLHTLALHDAIPICRGMSCTKDGTTKENEIQDQDRLAVAAGFTGRGLAVVGRPRQPQRSAGLHLARAGPRVGALLARPGGDRKSTRLNSSH